MSKEVNNKGISFVPAEALSDKAIVKLNELKERKKTALNKLVEDCIAGVLVPQT